MAEEKGGVAQAMKQVELQAQNKNLNEILQSTEAQTQSELKDASERTTYLQEYMTLNQDLAGKINGFLEKNQTFTDKFNAMIKQPSKSTVGRFIRTVPVLGRIGKAKGLNPQKASEVIMDMYTNMILEKDAVAKQLKLIEDRREDLFEQSNQAAQDLEKASNNFEKSKGSYEKVNSSLEVAKQLIDNNGVVGEIDYKALVDFYSKLDIQADQKPERINLVKLNQLADTLEREYAQVREDKVKYEIELNAANSALKGYRIQKDQFNAYVETTKVLLFGLETHLKYSKTLVENQAILAQAQETAIKALQAYGAYQETINQTFVMNAIGVQVMARETADMLSRDMFDEAALKEAADKTKEGRDYWNNFRSQYTSKAEDLQQKIKESRAPTA